MLRLLIVYLNQTVVVYLNQTMVKMTCAVFGFPSEECSRSLLLQFVPILRKSGLS